LIVRAVVCVALLALCAGVLSQPPTPTPSVKSQQEQAHPAATKEQAPYYPHGTDKNPVVIKSLEAEKSPERAQQERAERDEKATNEQRLVFWTIILAVATVALMLVAGGQLGMFWIQLGLMRRGVDDAAAAARAAKESADGTNALAQATRDEFFATHRPKLIVRRVSLDIGTDHLAASAPITKPSKFQYIVANVGEADAEIIESNVTPYTADGSNVVLPAILPFSKRTDAIPVRRIEPGDSCPCEADPNFNATLEQMAAERGKKQIFLFGYIVYAGASGARRRTQFCRVYNPQTQRFTVADPDHEYAD